MNNWITIALITIYFVVAIIWTCLATEHFKNSIFGYIVALIITPASVALLFVAAALSIPYFFIYPERHAHWIDFDGSDEQKKVLNQFRAELAKEPFRRRLLFCILRKSGPARPAILDEPMPQPLYTPPERRAKIGWDPRG